MFVYGRAVNQIGLNGWLETKRLLGEREDAPLLIGDALGRLPALVFDGMHTYNTAAKIRDRVPGETKDWASRMYPHWVKTAEQNGRISTLTVIPGYDDTYIREPGLKVKRHGGQQYRAQWDEAVAANPDWVLLTSFNEWYEGSEIEPSLELGEKYLEMTAKHAGRFRERPVRSGASSSDESAIGPGAVSSLREKLKGVGMAVLPNADSPAVWWLLGKMKLEPASPSWRELVEEPLDPEATPVLIYAGGEEYRHTVNEAGDVDRAIRRYMREGGWLVVLPSGPMPFYRGSDGSAVGKTGSFGLPLVVGGDFAVTGFEEPPEGKTLRFVQPGGSGEMMPHLPGRFGFPKEGDLRWRPLVKGELAPGDERTPLLVLRDGEGNYLGDAVSDVKLRGTEPTGGRVLYTWFTLLSGEYGDAVLHDMFRYVAEELGEG